MMGKIIHVHLKRKVKAKDAWATINGSHIHIGSGGEVTARAGGKFNGEKLSSVSSKTTSPSTSPSTKKNEVSSNTTSAKKSETTKKILNYFSLDI